MRSGASRDWTGDLPVANGMLFQLSYSPKTTFSCLLKNKKSAFSGPIFSKNTRKPPTRHVIAFLKKDSLYSWKNCPLFANRIISVKTSSVNVWRTRKELNLLFPHIRVLRKPCPLHYSTLNSVVGDEGIEPSASSLSERRSTGELAAQNFSAGSERRFTGKMPAPQLLSLALSSFNLFG